MPGVLGSQRGLRTAADGALGAAGSLPAARQEEDSPTAVDGWAPAPAALSPGNLRVLCSKTMEASHNAKFLLQISFSIKPF